MCCFKVRSAWSPSGHESAPDPLWPPFPSPSPTSSPTGWMEPTMAELREPTTRARLAAAALFSSSSTSRAVVGRRDLKHHTRPAPALPLPLPTGVRRRPTASSAMSSSTLIPLPSTSKVRSPPLLASYRRFAHQQQQWRHLLLFLLLASRKIRPFSMLNERFRANNVLIFHVRDVNIPRIFFQSRLHEDTTRIFCSRGDFPPHPHALSTSS